ncbi:MAG: hypothetical protein ACYC3X_26760 [Pirellulaceae bacterium]
MKRSISVLAPEIPQVHDLHSRYVNAQKAGKLLWSRNPEAKGMLAGIAAHSRPLHSPLRN